MYNKDLTIFSVFHKDYPQPNCDFIKPIQVGKALNTEDLGFLKDDVGDNISAKNPTYCELTAIYWIWKHLDQIESNFIGLSHYRRYFCLPETIKKKKLIFTIEKKNKDGVYSKPLTDEGLKEISSNEIKNNFLSHLNHEEIIVAKPTPLGSNKLYDFTIKDSYIYNHIREDWFLLEEALQKICPSYAEFAKTYFSTAKEMHSFNMFIGSKEFFNAYCNWLFPILAELESTVKLSEYLYQRRVFGFLAERLLNLYLKKNELPTVEYPVVFFE